MWLVYSLVMSRESDEEAIITSGEGGLESEEELPVVMRMVVEIRSDGRRTVARGALEDVTLGVKTQVRAKGGTPFQLALGLAKGITKSISRGPKKIFSQGKRSANRLGRFLPGKK